MQHAFLAALTAGQDLDSRRRSRWVNRVVQALTEGPEKVLGLQGQVQESMEKGQPNGWVVFDPGYAPGSVRATESRLSIPIYSKGVSQAYQSYPFKASILAVIAPKRTLLASKV